MTKRDSTKAKHVKKEEAAIAFLNKIKAAMVDAWAKLKPGDLMPFVIEAAAEGNVESARLLMGRFAEAVVKGETPHPLLQCYFAFCFTKILGDVDLRQALNLKHKNGRPTTAARDAAIVVGVEHLRSVKGYTNKKAMYEMAQIHFGDDHGGPDRVKNIMTKHRKSSLLRVKK